MDIVDLSWKEVISRRFNNSLLPRSIRRLIVGESGCGKTTLLLNLLIRPWWLDHDNLCVFRKAFSKRNIKHLKKLSKKCNRMICPGCFLSAFKFRRERAQVILFV